MKKVIKHLRIAIASVFLSIGHWVNAEDFEDFEAELRRLDTDYGRCSSSN
jgi:hypothetical protein